MKFNLSKYKYKLVYIMNKYLITTWNRIMIEVKEEKDLEIFIKNSGSILGIVRTFNMKFYYKLEHKF